MKKIKTKSLWTKGDQLWIRGRRMGLEKGLYLRNKGYELWIEAFKLEHKEK